MEKFHLSRQFSALSSPLRFPAKGGGFSFAMRNWNEEPRFFRAFEKKKVSVVYNLYDYRIQKFDVEKLDKIFEKFFLEENGAKGWQGFILLFRAVGDVLW